jgi:hypothetical protein
MRGADLQMVPMPSKVMMYEDWTHTFWNLNTLFIVIRVYLYISLDMDACRCPIKV